MSDTKININLCILDNKSIVRFDVAVGYRSDITPNPSKYKYIGKGRIHYENNVKSQDERRYKFYKETWRTEHDQ